MDIWCFGPITDTPFRECGFYIFIMNGIDNEINVIQCHMDMDGIWIDLVVAVNPPDSQFIVC